MEHMDQCFECIPNYNGLRKTKSKIKKIYPEQAGLDYFRTPKANMKNYLWIQDMMGMPLGRDVRAG